MDMEAEEGCWARPRLSPPPPCQLLPGVSGTDPLQFLCLSPGEMLSVQSSQYTGVLQPALDGPGWRPGSLSWHLPFLPPMWMR